MKLVVIGAGTGDRSVADLVRREWTFRLAGFVGTAEEATEFSGQRIHSDRIREEAFYEADLAGLIPVNVVSSKAIVEPAVRLGRGMVIFHGCIVGGACL